MFHHDYETYSDNSIKLGVSKYATGAEVLMLGYWSARDNKVKVWVPEHLGDYPNADGCEAEIKLSLKTPGFKYAHNANFERTITAQVAARDFGWAIPPVSDYRCTAAMCAALSLPRSLEKAATALRLSVNKDKRGKDLIKMFCIPQTKGARRIYPWDAPEAFREFIEYCRQDVVTEMALHDRLRRFELPASEQRVWELDSEFNALGLPMDVPLATTALATVKGYSARLTARFKAIAGVNPTQRDKALLWAMGEGYPHANLQAGTLDTYLKTCPPDTPLHEALSIRRSIGRSSIKKLQVVLDATVDGRMRDTLLYHGAHTGRWSGRNFQPQNLPRPTIKDVDTAIEAVSLGDLGVLEAMYTDPLEVVSSCLRGLIKAAPGKRLIVADYSSIEARVLCWVAGQADILAKYHRGFDAYIDMAGTVYRVPYDRVSNAQRRVGKEIILGCFGADTEVYTSNGIKRIVDVNLHDRVFDGVEWVSHEGIINQGCQEVIDLCGVTVTPDHLILSPTGWHTASHLAQSENTPCRMSALSLASSQLSGTCSVSPGASNVYGCDVAAERRKALSWGQSLGVVLPGVVPAHGVNPPQRGYSNGQASSRSYLKAISTDVTRSSTRIFNQKYASCAIAALTGFWKRITSSNIIGAARRVGGSTLQSMMRIPGVLRHCLTTCGIGHAMSSITWSGVLKYASGGNPLSTSTWTSKPLKGGQSSPYSTAYTMAGGTAGRIADSQTIAKATTTRATVYDIHNVESRHRFMIKTPAGPLVVHNCGFSMSGKTFYKTCQRNKVDITPEFAQKCVDVFRAKYDRVPAFWYTLEAVAIAAIQTKTVKTLGPLKIGVQDIFLFIKLPSGRKLAYPYPRIIQADSPWGPKDTLVFLGPIAESSIWSDSASTYGGKLAENVVQAIARDLMTHGMACAVDAGYQILTTIHDEVVSEVPQDFGSVEEFERVICTLPGWAKGVPLVAKGYSAQRYQKG